MVRMSKGVQQDGDLICFLSFGNPSGSGEKNGFDATAEETQENQLGDHCMSPSVS